MEKSGDRIAIIMPVYNEAETIGKVVKELYDKVAGKLENVDIWIFEDGSTDGTKEVLKKMKKEFPNLYVVMEKLRKGYPKAMKDAFLSIDAKKYQYVLSTDSDGQYEPNDIYKLLGIMEKEKPDIVMGRRVKRAEPFWRRILSQGLKVIEAVLFPLPCQDVTSVLRLMRTEIAQNMAKEVKYSKYNFWLELTARMALQGYKIIEVPVAYRARAAGESRVYSIRKIPKIVISELKTLMKMKKEWKKFK